jgi:hypothetical protein
MNLQLTFMYSLNFKGQKEHKGLKNDRKPQTNEVLSNLQKFEDIYG